MNNMEQLRPDVQLMLKTYEFLRDEILNSISWQYKLMTGEATIISIILGMGFTVEGWMMLLIAIPPTVLVLSSCWLVEQTRMMRAGDFLQLLEHKINSELGETIMIWENWLRRAGVRWYDPHRIHLYSQLIAVLGVFNGLGFLSLYMIWTQKLVFEPVCSVLCGLFLALLVLLLIFTLKVITHKRRYSIEEFANFCREYKNTSKKFKEQTG